MAEKGGQGGPGCRRAEKWTGKGRGVEQGMGGMKRKGTCVGPDRDMDVEVIRAREEKGTEGGETCWKSEEER